MTKDKILSHPEFHIVQNSIIIIDKIITSAGLNDGYHILDNVLHYYICQFKNVIKRQLGLMNSV